MLVASLTVLVLALPAGSARVPDQQRIQQIVRHVFPDDQARALCVARAESHLTAAAQNGDNTGLFQVDRGTWDPQVNPRALPIVGRISWARMHEALYNARVARRIYLYERRTRRDANGWAPWSTRGLCAA